MYEIIFYRDKNGKNEIEEYLQKLKNENSKYSRIKFNKITACINMLEYFEDYIKRSDEYEK